VSHLPIIADHLSVDSRKLFEDITLKPELSAVDA
jgi:hypothetical protein